VHNQVLDAVLCQTLHGPHQSLKGGYARRNDLLYSQAFDGGLDQRQ
jgi:hypothetical protein